MLQIETERLLLREPLQTDAPEMLTIRNSDFVQKYNAMRVIDEERFRKLIAKDIENKTALYLVLKNDARLIGGVWFDEDDKRYDVKAKYLSFYLDEPYARQGYMKEALRAVITWLFWSDPVLEVLSSSVFSDNAASESLLRSLGFTFEGCLRRAVRDPRGTVHDDKQFSLLREEWTEKGGAL